MYTSVAVRELDSDRFTFIGHAYDISAGGMRFELDTPIEPGTRVAVRIALPGGRTQSWATPRAVFAFANVLWIEEDDLDTTGPVRMACAFTNFCKPNDEAVLMQALDSGRFARAA
jgi:hypothetical protein